MESTIGKTNFNAPIDLTPEAEPSYLTQANTVGQGLDVFDKISTESFVMPLMDPLKSGLKSFNFLGKEFLIPKYVTPIENTKAYYQGGTCNTREEFQNNIAAQASVKVGYGLFSGEMKSAFERQYKTSSEYAYTYNNFYSTLGILEMGESTGDLRNTFQASIDALPNTVNEGNLNAFVDFFRDYGIYYTDKVEMGGSLEFYVSVKKTSQMTDMQISAMIDIQYKGLFTKGGISSEIKASASWKNYSSYSEYNIIVTGGNPALAGRLSRIDPLNPSEDSLKAYDEWLASVNTSPAITNMRLKGIWMLCGDKKNVVNQAWELYGPTIHPKITIETEARVILWPITQSPRTPIITVNGDQVKPKIAATSPTGYQATILSNDGNIPVVLYDKYFCLDPSEKIWNANWKILYNQLVTEIEASEHYKKDNILLLTSFGMGNNLCPTREGYEFLKFNGAGKRLEFWETHCSPGSVGGQAPWISNSLNYIMASNLRNGPNVGVELLQFSEDYTTPINSQSFLYLFKDSFTGKYTLAG